MNDSLRQALDMSKRRKDRLERQKRLVKERITDKRVEENLREQEKKDRTKLQMTYDILGKMTEDLNRMYEIVLAFNDRRLPKLPESWDVHFEKLMYLLNVIDDVEPSMRRKARVFKQLSPLLVEAKKENAYQYPKLLDYFINFATKLENKDFSTRESDEAELLEDDPEFYNRYKKYIDSSVSERASLLKRIARSL